LPRAAGDRVVAGQSGQDIISAVALQQVAALVAEQVSLPTPPRAPFEADQMCRCLLGRHPAPRATWDAAHRRERHEIAKSAAPSRRSSPCPPLSLPSSRVSPKIVSVAGAALDRIVASRRRIRLPLIANDEVVAIAAADRIGPPIDAMLSVALKTRRRDERVVADTRHRELSSPPMSVVPPAKERDA
jgi:hypothetical protein